MGIEETFRPFQTCKDFPLHTFRIFLLSSFTTIWLVIVQRIQ